MKAKCIRGYSHDLTVGETYTVEEVENHLYLLVIDKFGNKIPWRKNRFEIIKTDPEKRNNLIAELKQVEQSKLNK